MIWWQSTITKPVVLRTLRNLPHEGFSFALGRFMRYKELNTRRLTTKELIDVLHKSAILYSEYVDTTLLFIFREKKIDSYDYYEVRFGKNNFMHLAGIKS